MLYMHYCKCCNRVFMLNGHRMICPRCAEPLTELKISYLDYVQLNVQEREEFRDACADEEKLKKLRRRYRMHKYCQWYKDLQAENTENVPITTLLAEKERAKQEDRIRKQEEAEKNRKRRPNV